jgi:hypothetical protein
MAATVAVFIIAAPLPIIGRQPEQAFLAVVRHDGSMIPIAAYDGQQWWDRWPSASHGGDLPSLPSSLSSIPSDWLPPGMRLPVEWRLQAPDGRQLRIIAQRPVRLSLEQEAAIGVQSDYTSTTAPDDGDDALAVSGTARWGRFVHASRRESEAIARQLSNRLEAIEPVEVARWIRETERPSDTAQKLRRVFRDEMRSEPAPFHLMRAERLFNGTKYYHLTGEKLYAGATAGDDSCKMNMSFDGVVATDREGRVVFENVVATAWAEYCGDPASWNEPIATLQLRNQLVWIGFEHLEDGSSYFLMDPRTRTPLTLRR